MYKVCLNFHYLPLILTFNKNKKKARKAWREYLPDVNAIAYLVDSSDKERFAENKQEIDVYIYILKIF